MEVLRQRAVVSGGGLETVASTTTAVLVISLQTHAIAARWKRRYYSRKQFY